MATAVRRRPRLGAVEWVMLGAFSALSIWLYVALIWRARTTGLTWTSTDGPFLGDQMQYLGWIRDASTDLRIGNPFRLDTGGQFFVHPGLAISGLLHRIGLSPALAYLIWKPIAVLTLFMAVRTYVRRNLVDPVPRYVAMALALFALAPISILSHIGPEEGPLYYHGMALEMWPGLYLWGYPFTALAVALVPITLLAYERARRCGRLGLGAPVCGFLCSWLQPWQGATLVAIVLGTEVLLRRREHSASPLLTTVTVTATALPLGYYAALSRFDSGWALAGEANRGPWPWWAMPLFFVPIVVVVGLGYRRPARTFQDLALRVWPVAALGVFCFILYTPFGTYQLHALQGLGIPVAVLAVRGVTSLGATWKSPIVLALLAGMLLACIGWPLERELRFYADNVVHSHEAMYVPAPYFLTDGERDAINYLEADSRRGGVLSRVYLGQTVPALTGRRTWVGIASWTPDFHHRVELASDLFAGRMGSLGSQRLVRRTGARFLLSDCRTGVDLRPLLGKIVLEVRRFGCAAIYRVR